MDEINPRDLFLTVFRKNSKVRTALVDHFTNDLANNHLVDLQPQVGHFALATQILLTEEAAKRWTNALHPTEDRLELARIWSQLAADFHQNGHWGLSTQRQKEKPKKKPRSFAVSMMITVLVSFVVAKVAVLAAASRVSEDPSAFNEWVLGAIIVASFANLFYFAFKHSRNAPEER